MELSYAYAMARSRAGSKSIVPRVGLVSWMFDVVQWDEGDRRVVLLPDVPDALSCNYFVYCLAVLRTQTRDQEGRHVILVARLSGERLC